MPNSLIHSFFSCNLQACAGPFGTEHAQQASGRKRTLDSRRNQEKEGGARGGALGIERVRAAARRKLPDRPEGGHRAEKGGRGARNRGARSALKGTSCNARAGRLFPGVSPGRLSPGASGRSRCRFRRARGDVRLGVREQGPGGVSAMPRSASQAASGCGSDALHGRFLAQMRAPCQR